MASLFYKTHGRTILWAAAITFPLLSMQATSIKSNNDIETWLPRNAEIRKTFDEFKRDFGADETVLVAFPTSKAKPRLVDAVAARLQSLDGVAHCWTADRLRTVMRELGVPDAEIDQRLRGFLISEDGKTLGIIAVLSVDGTANRLKTVEEIRSQLAYCQLTGDGVSVAGSPVIVAELDRLGNSKNNQKFFLITLAISFVLLYYSLRDWKVTAAVLGIAIWAINATTVIVKYSGGEMNFILGALSVMVMVFTLAICVHFIHYYEAAVARHGRRTAISAALRCAWKPCCLATVTTTIGLLSLTVSDIGAVKMFGTSAAIGSVVALVAGLGLMPAVLTVWPLKTAEDAAGGGRFAAVANWLVQRKVRVAVVTGLLVAFTSVGLLSLKSRIEPLDFLPADNKVLADVHHVEKHLVKINSIEAVVDFGDEDLAFIDRVDRVRRIEAKLKQHPSVFQTTSAATFFPSEFPKDAWATASLLKTAEKRWAGGNEYVADGKRLWRISARIEASPDRPRKQIIAELQKSTAGERITFTGMAPLLEEAQTAIFDGFWESFVTAFGIILLVMIVSLRSWKAGLVAMIPNLTPLCIVFGMLGWLGIPVDIGMMMTGSIALGIAVDGTFHFLVHYNSRMRESGDSQDASRDALTHAGAPIMKAAVIAAIGMLALTLSNFVPTARFGYMMATLLVAALVGDLVLLPAVLAMRPKSRKAVRNDEAEEEVAVETRDPAVIAIPHIIVRPERNVPAEKSGT